MSRVSALVLTCNHEKSLPGCVESIIEWCDDIHVFDSFSTDRTVMFAQLIGAKVTSRCFDDWPSHRDWGLRNIPFRHDWVLCVNADERVSSALSQEIHHAVQSAGETVAFSIQRRAHMRGYWPKQVVECNHPIRLIRPRYLTDQLRIDSDGVINVKTGSLIESLDSQCFETSKHWFEPRSWFEQDAHTSHSTKT
jgi:glycosyltransferase involved in cell wall biosynthesis